MTAILEILLFPLKLVIRGFIRLGLWIMGA